MSRIIMLALLVCFFNQAAFALSKTEQQQIVAEHNKLRQAVGVPPLKWSNKVAQFSKSWAATLNKSACKLKHSRGSGYGENLYWASPIIMSNGTKKAQSIKPAQVVGQWSKEQKDYNYASNRCKKGKVCGHYTQVVWKKSTAVGCAKTVCGNKSQVWVCNYSPPGNMRGQKPY